MPDPIEPSLTGMLCVLVVEDEMLIALDLQLMLEDAGHRVLGPVGAVDKALSLLDGARPDVVLLDLNLRGELATPVAERLRSLGVPFIMTSADTSVVRGDAAFEGAMEITKPVLQRDLLAALDRVASGR